MAQSAAVGTHAEVVQSHAEIDSADVHADAMKVVKRHGRGFGLTYMLGFVIVVVLSRPKKDVVRKDTTERSKPPRPKGRRPKGRRPKGRDQKVDTRPTVVLVVPEPLGATKNY